jgi:hypothetical protein
VEHLLSALECCGVDNARIEMEGGYEVPVTDGSAQGWAINIVVAGLQPAYAYKGRGKGPMAQRALQPQQVRARALCPADYPLGAARMHKRSGCPAARWRMVGLRASRARLRNQAAWHLLKESWGRK